MNNGLTIIHAAMIADGAGLSAAPGTLLLDGDRIVAAGSPQSIGEVRDGQRIDMSQYVLLPGLVNAHAHLDLTHIGPVPFTGDFVSWVDRVRAERALSESEIAASVRRGVELARAGGTVLIGDIAGIRSLAPLHALRESGMPGVSYLEIFGIGRRQAAAVELMRTLVASVPHDEAGVRLGVQPHAPYSCGVDVYRAAASLGLPLATHLAETLEELQFVASGDGELAAMLQRIGVWDETVTAPGAPAGGEGCHSVELLADVLGKEQSCVAAHLNYIDDRHIELLASLTITVAYCPRASAYFGHPHGEHPPHRYRDMLTAGINVALGTDSILCLDTPDRISVLDDMRYLYRRDGADPHQLLRMATVNGASALGFGADLVTLAAGPTLGVIAVQGRNLHDVLYGNDPPQWVISA